MYFWLWVWKTKTFEKWGLCCFEATGVLPPIAPPAWWRPVLREGGHCSRCLFFSGLDWSVQKITWSLEQHVYTVITPSQNWESCCKFMKQSKWRLFFLEIPGCDSCISVLHGTGLTLLRCLVSKFVSTFFQTFPVAEPQSLPSKKPTIRRTAPQRLVMKELVSGRVGYGITSSKTKTDCHWHIGNTNLIAKHWENNREPGGAQIDFQDLGRLSSEGDQKPSRYPTPSLWFERLPLSGASYESIDVASKTPNSFCLKHMTDQKTALPLGLFFFRFRRVGRLQNCANAEWRKTDAPKGLIPLWTSAG